MGKIRAMLLTAALFTGGCEELLPICLDDADGDGICGSDDPCPIDATNDEDGDGVCGSIDICEGHDDALDADEDGIPDGCDVCPDDAGNDDDEDGICAADDYCPNSPATDCTRTVTFGTLSDHWPKETGFRVYTDSGVTLLETGPESPLTGELQTLDVPTDAGRLCIDVFDAPEEPLDPDGGFHAWAYDEDMGRMLFDILPTDYTDTLKRCGAIRPGNPFNEELTYDKASWLQAPKSCELLFEQRLESYAYEVYWQVQLPEEANPEAKPIVEARAGSYASSGIVQRTERLVEGSYNVLLGDTYGDGWHGGTLTIFQGQDELMPPSAPQASLALETIEVVCP